MIIKSLEELSQLTKHLKKNKKTIVWTNGCFDLLHPGHLKTFEECKKLGDILIVWLNGDLSPYWQEKPGRPINSEVFRATMLSNIKHIDYVYIFNEETPIEPIKIILPDILAKWWDYEIEKIVGYAEVMKNGGKVVTIPTLGNYSTSNIIQKILKTYESEKI